MATFDEVPASISFPKMEEAILRHWKETRAFERSMELARGRPLYSFYDGPPFATGLPHYGHLLAGTIKDVVTRFAAMQGYYVERRFGWDCHGLPVEYEIDKAFGIKSKEDVMKMGIDRYNAECKAIVMRYSKEWEATVNRCGRWIDFENDYKTLNLSFMESVWWVFKQFFDKNLVYRGFKVMPYSTGCNTPLSNFEAGQNYKDVNDPAVIVSFPLVEDPEVKLIAWTTTPWTLPSNLALCVHPDFDYIKIKDIPTGNIYILLEARLGALYKNPEKATEFEVLARMKGSDLKGKRYVPLLPYFAEKKKATSFVVLNDTYVTSDSGTGIVHQAPAFGEDDFRVCMAAGVFGKGDGLVCPVDDSGRFTDEVPDFAGQYVKDADKNIIRKLKEIGRLVHSSTIVHSYPFCWRSETPLIYKAVPSWFVRVEAIKQQLLANNQKTYWVPDFVKDKRFHNWLESALDWAISRSRYWGTPIPLWVSDNFEEIVCVGSVAELEELTGVKNIQDLHRHHIDKLTIPSKKGNGVLHRIDEVFDCWFESGSMPYAQSHYPFENKEVFEKSFPADFIAEGLDQTRGWFYTLMVIATGLFDQPAFKNLIVNGLVLASDGRKMSKRLRNYPDPNSILDNYGADALRLYLTNSPVVRAEPLRFKEEGVHGIVKDVFLPWFNAYRFFIQNVTRLQQEDGVQFTFNPADAIPLNNSMDKWILAATGSLVEWMGQELKAYRLYTVVPKLLQYIESLTNWYVRFNRKRLKGEMGRENCLASLQALFESLLTLCKLMAPFTPFLSEYVFLNLRKVLPDHAAEGNGSVHFQLFPEPDEKYRNPVIERAVGRMQRVIELGRVIRERRATGLKHPLNKAIVVHSNQEYLDDVGDLEMYVLEELNIREIEYSNNPKQFGLRYKLEPDSKALGPKMGKAMQEVLKALKQLTSSQVQEFASKGVIEILGKQVSIDDVKVIQVFEGEDKNLEADSDNDVIVVLDFSPDKGLQAEGIAREFINRIQRLRKTAGIQASDNVTMYYEIVPGPDSQLADVLVSQRDFIVKTLKVFPQLASARPAGAVAISEKEEVIGNARVKLYLHRN